MEHPERLQASVGRLDPAESREEGRGTVEGEALHFISIKGRRRILFTRVFAAHSTSGIDIPHRSGIYYQDYRWVYLNSPDSYGDTLLRRLPPPGFPSVFRDDQMRNRDNSNYYCDSRCQSEASSEKLFVQFFLILF
jgi:hypothetical protein